MPGFADSFWSSDYAAGLGVLFTKLQQGVHENRQVLTIARLRAEAEETYGQRLGDIAPSADKIAGGFSRDDGATVRKVCEHASLPKALSACDAVHCRTMRYKRFTD